MSTLVTGAASGIGRAVALRLAPRGGTLVLADVNREGLEETAALLRGAAAARCELLDVRDPNRCAEVVGFASAADSGLRSVAHCAGIVRGDSRLADLAPEEWDEIIAINLTGTANVLRAAIPRLVDAGGGAVVLVSSIAALRGRRRIAAYSASKAGMIGLAQAVVADYARDGIRVNCVCPGAVDTPLSAHLSLRKPWNAAGRKASAGEVAAVIAWLLDEESAWINAAAIPVDAAETAVYGGAFASHRDADAGAAHEP